MLMHTQGKFLNNDYYDWKVFYYILFAVISFTFPLFSCSHNKNELNEIYRCDCVFFSHSLNDYVY